jgi:hypothetical protein
MCLDNDQEGQSQSIGKVSHGIDGKGKYYSSCSKAEQILFSPNGNHLVIMSSVGSLLSTRLSMGLEGMLGSKLWVIEWEKSEQ